MPHLERSYPNTRFRLDTVQAAIKIFNELSSSNKKLVELNLHTGLGNDSWKHDNIDDFLMAYSSPWDEFSISLSGQDSDSIHIRYMGIHSGTVIQVGMKQKIDIFSIMNIFEKEKQEIDKLKENTKKEFTIFIGHGRSALWRQLKDHLHDLHKYDVEAYETAPRAGLSVKEVLNKAKDNASFALLVHTAEDEMSDGSIRARENVVHETGLFQGKLGFERAIILLEEGCKDYSNISGITQIRFSKGNVKEVFGEVIATIKREFGR